MNLFPVVYLKSLKVVILVSLNYENLPEFLILCYPGIIADQSINTEFLHLIIKTDLNKKDISYRTGLHTIVRLYYSLAVAPRPTTIECVHLDLTGRQQIHTIDKYAYPNIGNNGQYFAVLKAITKVFT